MTEFQQCVCYYTIPRIKRELKLAVQTIEYIRDYTIPRIKRELKPQRRSYFFDFYYTIPRIKRELKRLAF